MWSSTSWMVTLLRTTKTSPSTQSPPSLKNPSTPRKNQWCRSLLSKIVLHWTHQSMICLQRRYVIYQSVSAATPCGPNTPIYHRNLDSARTQKWSGHSAVLEILSQRPPIFICTLSLHIPMAPGSRQKFTKISPAQQSMAHQPPSKGFPLPKWTAKTVQPQGACTT